MSYIFSNDINTTLAVAINSTQTTISVASSANLPTLAEGDVLPITLSDAATHSNYEVCYCTAISGTDLTVLRGMEGTTAQSWLLNDLCYNAHTAGTTASFDGGLGTDSGAANAYVVTVPMTLTAYQVGMVVRFIPANASTSAGSTINVNGLGVVDLLGQAGLALQEKEVATGLTAAIYNGTAFVLLYSIGGTVQVPPATASNQAVNLGQIQVISIADLEAAPVPIMDGTSIRVLGYAAEGDGGGGVFYWNASSTATPNGATIILPTGYSGNGRWFREFSGSVNPLWWGADKTGGTDSSTAIQDAMNYAVANGFLSVYFTPGTYLTNTTINWSPYVPGWTDGDVLWTTASTTNTMMIYISTRWGNSSNAGFTVPAVFDGKFHFKLTASNTSIACLYVGDGTSGSGYGATNITFSHLQIDNFYCGVQFGNTAYMVNFNHCYFMNTSYHIYTGSSLTDTGERISFTDCTLTGCSINVLSLNTPIECRFINCSIDYNAAIGSNFTYSNLCFDQCHIEWNEATTLFVNTSGTTTTFICLANCLFNFAGNSSPPNPLIATIGPNTFLNLSNPRFELADTGLTLFNISSSTGTFFGPSIYAYSGNVPGTYVANTGTGTLHTF